MRNKQQKLGKRYKLQPNDLVRFDGNEQRVKGVHCKGTRVMLDTKKSVSIKKVELITYGKSLSFKKMEDEAIPLQPNNMAVEEGVSSQYR